MFLAPLLISAGSSIVGSLFGAQSDADKANAQADYNNKLAIAQYKQQQQDRLAKFTGEINAYNQAKLQYKQGRRDSLEAFYRGVGENQQYLNDIRSKIGIESMNTLMDSLAKQGSLQASNAAGRSSERAMRMIKGQAGQQTALNQESLANAVNAIKGRNESLLISKKSADNQLYSQVAMAPDPGFAPVAPVLQGYSSPNWGNALLGGLVGGVTNTFANNSLSSLGIGKY